MPAAFSRHGGQTSTLMLHGGSHVVMAPLLGHPSPLLCLSLTLSLVIKNQVSYLKHQGMPVPLRVTAPRDSLMLLYP